MGGFGLEDIKFEDGSPGEVCDVFTQLKDSGVRPVQYLMQTLTHELRAEADADWSVVMRMSNDIQAKIEDLSETLDRLSEEYDKVVKK
jgi:hypothetical protein